MSVTAFGVCLLTNVMPDFSRVFLRRPEALCDLLLVAESGGRSEAMTLSRVRRCGSWGVAIRYLGML